MSKKTKRLRAGLASVFNRNFFGFLSGFLGMVFVALVFVFVASYYKIDTIGNRANLDAEAPTKQANVENVRNASLAGKSFELASSTKKSLRQ